MIVRDGRQCWILCGIPFAYALLFWLGNDFVIFCQNNDCLTRKQQLSVQNTFLLLYFLMSLFIIHMKATGTHRQVIKAFKHQGFVSKELLVNLLGKSNLGRPDREISICTMIFIQNCFINNISSYRTCSTLQNTDINENLAWITCVNE